ncbi:MAG: hypothetical protein DRZ79_04280 [Candidatus Cloacimonadota bacterium]|nr:MAG: hypothetical protein DRZ79_04280 [Candidatus Cloacimonadota bacterium]
MKKTLILLCLTSSILLSATNLSFLNKFQLETYYHSNILKYSNDDEEEFKNSLNPEKYKIDSLDDLVLGARAQFGLKHRFFFGHTQLDKLVFKYNYYANNEVKNNVFVGAVLKQFLRKNFYLKFGYYYYPKIYIKQYKSVLDDSETYHEFSYAKNSYFAILNFFPVSFLGVSYNFGFSQLFHNKYFTEFDANVFRHKSGLKLNIPQNLAIGFYYEYKISDPRNNGIPENIETEDASYESNVYSFVLLNSGFLKSGKFTVKLGTTIRLEERFYQTSNPTDKFHYAREDDILSIDSYVKIPCGNNFGIKLFYGYEIRQTDSPYEFVISAKEYSLYKTGLTIFFEK